MAVDINRELSSIRARPGDNYLYWALKKLADEVNSKAATPAASSAPAASTTPAATVTPATPASSGVEQVFGGNAITITGTPTKPTVSAKTATGSSEGVITLAQDLGGTADLPKVVGLQGVPVSSTAPTDGYVLEYVGADSQWEPKAGGGSGVSSLDSITGAVTLVAGSNITITDNSPSAGDITIAASGGGGGSTWPWDVIQPSLTPSYPLLTDFSWVNQLTATATQSDTSHPIQWISNSSTATNNVSALVKAYPSTPFTLTLGFAGSTFRVSYNSFGIILQDSVSGKISILGTFFNYPTASQLFVERVNYNSPSSFNGYNSGATWSGAYITWLKLTDDGTNLTLSYSFDGVNYLTALTQVRTTFLTPDHIGFGSDKGGGIPYFASLFYWNIA